MIRRRYSWLVVRRIIEKVSGSIVQLYGLYVVWSLTVCTGFSLEDLPQVSRQRWHQSQGLERIHAITLCLQRWSNTSRAGIAIL